MLRLLSLGGIVAAWQVAALAAGPSSLPAPLDVLRRAVVEAQSGALGLHLGATLLRVAPAFLIAMTVGTVAGVVMGRNRHADRLGDPLLVLLLNLPALVVIVLAYIWIGLNEVAAVVAVALNKIPSAIVTMREGSRALDPQLDEMATLFRVPAGRRLRHVVIPQLAPYLAATARSGLSLVWKIVLVVELLGRSNGVGFEINLAFQLFDLTLLLAYALPFVALMLLIESLLVQPFERAASRWRFP